MTDLSNLPRLSDIKPLPARIFPLTKLVTSLVAAKGITSAACYYAEQHHADAPMVATALKAAVVAGSGSGWGSQLQSARPVASEYVSAVRAASILGKLIGVRRVPMNISVPRSTSASSAEWVQEGYAMGVSEMAFDTITLGVSKIGGLAVISSELARTANPDAQALIQADLVESAAVWTDVALLSPQYAAVANKNPASLTNTVAPITSSGVTSSAVSNDLRSAVAAMLSAGGPLQSPVWVTTPRIKFALAMLRDSQNNTAFPEVALNGSLGGAPILASSSVPSSVSGGGLIILLDQAELLVADPGEVEVDASGQASLQMNTAPATGAQQLVGLWQNDLLALKVLRYINWAPKHAAGATCQWIDGVML